MSVAQPLTADAPYDLGERVDVPPPGATGERMTVAEFADATHLTDREYELVRGWVVDAAAWMAGSDFDPRNLMPRPKPRHGHVCQRISALLDRWNEDPRVGTVLINDTGVVTGEGETPDEQTLRGPDVIFYSDARMPLDEDVPEDWQTVAPEVAFEVRSPNDRPGQFRRKAAEYLAAGSLLVVWADPDRRRLTLVDAAGERHLSADETLEAPDVLPGFAVPVTEFFRR